MNFWSVLARCSAALALVGTLGAPSAALAQAYPTKPVKLVVSYPAGGPSDAVGRAIGKELQTQLSQPVFVENKAGVSGLIGLDALSASPPDGYTLMVLNNTTTTALHAQNKPLDFDKRIAPVGQFVGVRMILVVNPKVVDVQNIGELVAYARRSKDPMQYTSSGPGSPGHLLMEGFAKHETFEVQHVPYKGSNPALMDAVAGRVGVMVVEASSAVQHVRNGSLRAIATVSPGRAPLLPDLKTSTEQGFPALVMDSSFGVIAPPGTPEPVLERVRAALRKAVEAPDFVAQSKTAGNAIEYVGGAAYRDRLIKDFDRWGQVIKATGVSLN